MIGRLRGNILEKQPPLVLLEANGVGYEVHMPMTCFYELPELGQEAIVFTHFVVREDAQLLYGFNDKQERALFRELIKVNGVGPKLALAILSGMSAQQFVSAVEREEITALVKLPGVGKKTAERLVVEMKDRFKGSTATCSTTAAKSRCRPPPTPPKWMPKPKRPRRWWRWVINRRKPAAWSAKSPSRAPIAKP